MFDALRHLTQPMKGLSWSGASHSDIRGARAAVQCRRRRVDVSPFSDHPGRWPLRRQRGVSLIELIFFIVVVSVALAGVLAVMDQAARGSADPLVRKQAMALAESIMQEVEQKAFSDPDGVGGESSRAAFDDVDDFNGLGNAVFADLPAALSLYVIAISVTPATLGTIAAKRIVVTVTRGPESVQLTGYRTGY